MVLIYAAIIRNSISQFIIIIIIIVILPSWVFFTQTLADGLSLESEWLQVSSDLQDFSQYSGRS